MHENFTFRGNHHYIKGKSIFLTRMKNSNMIVRYIITELGNGWIVQFKYVKKTL